MQQFRDASVATEDEVRGVLELHLQNRDLQPGVSTRDLAEAMRISEAEVEALLATVRTRTQHQASSESDLQTRKRRKRRDVMLATIVALLIIVPLFLTTAGPLVRMFSPMTQHPVVTYYISLDGKTASIPARVHPAQASTNYSLAALLADESGALLAHEDAKAPVPTASRVDLITQLETGKPGPDFGTVTVELFSGWDSGRRIKVDLPTYSGSDREIRATLSSLRTTRIQEALREISTRAQLEQNVGL